MSGTDVPVQLGIGTVQAEPGWTEVIRPPNPAAGSNFSRPVPVDTWERLRTLQFTFTASAVVATRTPRLILRDADGVEIFRQIVCSGVVASTSVLVNVAPGISASFAASGISQGAIMDLLAHSRWAYSIEVGSIDVGDQISGITMLVRRIPTELSYIDLQLP